MVEIPIWVLVMLCIFAGIGFIIITLSIISIISELCADE